MEFNGVGGGIGTDNNNTYSRSRSSGTILPLPPCSLGTYVVLLPRSPPSYLYTSTGIITR